MLLADHNATKGILTTTSNFAPMIACDPFIKPHIPFRLELVDGQELNKRLWDLARDRTEPERESPQSLQWTVIGNRQDLPDLVANRPKG